MPLKPRTRQAVVLNKAASFATQEQAATWLMRFLSTEATHSHDGRRCFVVLPVVSVSTTTSQVCVRMCFSFPTFSVLKTAESSRRAKT